MTEHKAGCELDALVAEKAMGAYWTERENVCRILWNVEGEEMVMEEWYEKDWVPSKAPLPAYSTQIAETKQVLEKMISNGYAVEIVHDCVAWSVCFVHIDTSAKYCGDWKDSLEVQICNAALKAMEG